MVEFASTAASGHAAIWLVAALLVAGLGATTAFGFQAGSASGRWRVARPVASGLAAGATIWVTLALLVLAEDRGQSGSYAGLGLTASILLSLVGATAAMVLGERATEEWGYAAPGAILGLTALATKSCLAAGGYFWSSHGGFDPAAGVIAIAAAVAAGASATLVSRMALGLFAAPAAGAILAATIFIADYASGSPLPASASAAASAAGPSGVPREGFLLAVMAGLLVIAGVAALGWTKAHLSALRAAAVVQERTMERNAVGGALCAELRMPLEALRGCLDFMASETLPLKQRSRLDTARACAHDLEALVAATTALLEHGAREEDQSHRDVREVRQVREPDARARVLVADDSDTHRAVAGEILKRLGARVTFARNGRDALAVMAQESFDIVLMDTEMPVLGGIAATERARSDRQLEGSVIIGVSANCHVDRVEALEAGMDDIVAKPLRVEVLERLLQQWCEPRLDGAPLGA